MTTPTPAPSAPAPGGRRSRGGLWWPTAVSLGACAVLLGFALFFVGVYLADSDREDIDDLLLVFGFLATIPIVVSLVLLGIGRAVHRASETAGVLFAVLSAVVAVPCALAFVSLFLSR